MADLLPRGRRWLLALTGELGAGKTTFVRGLLRGMGHTGRVRSPTYTLVEPYHLEGRDVLHLDLYRIGDPGELDFLGIPDLIDERTLLLVEWPERGAGHLPGADLSIALEHSDDVRFVYLQPHSADGRALCRKLTQSTSS